MYIENVRQKFGMYLLAATKTPFDPTLLNSFISKLILGTALDFNFCIDSGGMLITTNDSTDCSSDPHDVALDENIWSNTDVSTVPKVVICTNRVMRLNLDRITAPVYDMPNLDDDLASNNDDEPPKEKVCDKTVSNDEEMTNCLVIDSSVRSSDQAPSNIQMALIRNVQI